jgi:hemerythrin-like metal-binding protein
MGVAMLNQVGVSQGIEAGNIFDRQHMQINRKHQNLRAAILKGRGMDRIIESSKELVAATVAHFQSEESAMDATAPGNFSSHRRMHEDMMDSLRDISTDLEHRRIQGAMELMKFFEGRLTYHLDVEDAVLESALTKSE